MSESADARAGPPPAAEPTVAGRSVGRSLLVALVAGGVILLLVVNRREVPAVWASLRAARPVWVGLAVGAVALGWLNLAALHAAAQRALGLPTVARQVAVPALAAQFLNLLFSSGGLAGLSVFRADGRRRGLEPGPVTGSYLLVAVAGQLAVIAVLPVAFAILVGTGRLTTADVVVSAVFLLYSMILVVLVVEGVRSRSALRRAYALPRRLVAGALRRPRPTVEPTRADELYDALQLLRAAPRRAVRIAVHAVGVDVGGIVLLWLVLRALSLPLGFQVAVVAYAVSLMFSIVGFLPGGLGFVEVSLAAVLVSYGTPGVAAAAAVALFRLFELWLPLAAGALAARVVLRSSA